ncbi:MAG: LamG-like jellyroll fold domain-containing protein, partial [Armatimonadota bacterium]
MKRWQIVTSALAVIVALSLLSAFALGATGDGPVAQWTFNGEFRRLSRDVAASKYHAVAADDYAHVQSPGRQAIVLDGVDDSLRVPDDPALVMTDALTIDVWLRLDSADGGHQCVVDKGGERYRIQVSGTSAMFGLKAGDERMDLSGGELVPGQWHRITGVFDRPDARLYIDGEEVGSRTWDHEIGPGGDLFIGSKGGVTYFFGGEIDEVRIYDYARAPEADDAPSTDPVGAGGMIDAKLDVQELDDGARVDTGAAVFELTDDGGLRALTIGGEPVIAGNELPLMAASVFESTDYDGWRDHASGEIVEATWRTDQHRYDANDEEFTATYTGTLDFGGGDAIGCELALAIRRGSPFLTATVALEHEGDFGDRFIRDVSLRLPLALDRRKRVVQGGDRGIQWNTRHFYQFHVGPTQRLLNEPDHNIFRRFAVDQNSATDYHLWRSESRATPALTMQRGEQAPGWMAAYDERAGLIFGYRDFADSAPKSLRVEAEGSGEARVCLWHEGLPALAVDSPQAASVFGKTHRLDVAPFDDEFSFAQPDVALAAQWGLDGLASDPPNRNEMPLDGLNPLAEESAEDEAPLITGGVALPRGAVSDPENVRLQHDGADVPVQTKPVGYWPDGSIMWLLLSFPPEGGE